MTAPTQGKERGAAPPPAVPSLPPPHPSLAPFLAPLAPRAREPRALESTALSSLSSRLASCSRPTEKLAPHPAQISLFRPVRTLLAGAQGLGRCGTREPQASGQRGWEGGAFPGATAPFLGRASVWRPLSAAAAGVCAPSSRVPPRAQGHRWGWSAAPSRVPGAGRGRDPDRRVRELEFAPRVRGCKEAAGVGPFGVGRGKTSEAKRPGAIPRDPQQAQPQSPEGKPAEGRGLCVRARVRVSACELVQRR